MILVFIAMVALFAGVVIGMTLLRAFVITQIWGWYIVPMFGLNPLTMIFAFGLSCSFGLFMMSTIGAKADALADDSLSVSAKFFIAITPILATLLIWGMAAIGTNWLPEPVDPVEIEQTVDIDL